MIDEHLRNWIPYRFEKDGTTNCRWLYLGEKNFEEPFFDETISRCQSLPENSSCYRVNSSNDFLAEAAHGIAGIEPTAILFHVSRCGSTLLSQLLALEPAHIILSEVPFFDECLRRIHDRGAEGSLLNAALRFYCQRRSEEQQRVFIKTDSWHLHFYNEWRAQFPSAQFVILYRDPVEVLASQQRKRGMQSVPGVIEPDVFGFDSAEMEGISLDDYMMRVLESYFERILGITAEDDTILLFNYNQGMEGAAHILAEKCSIPMGMEWKEKMRKRTGYHGKFPGEKFVEANRDLEKISISPRLKAMYAELERRREKILS